MIFYDKYDTFRKDRFFYNIYDLLWDINPLKLDRSKDFSDEYELIVIDILDNQKSLTEKTLKEFIESRFKYWCGNIKDLKIDKFVEETANYLKLKEDD